MEGRISTLVHMFLLLPLIYEESRNNGKKLFILKVNLILRIFDLMRTRPQITFSDYCQIS